MIGYLFLQRNNGTRTQKYDLKIQDVEINFASRLYFKEIETLKMKISETEQKLTCMKTELLTEEDSQNIMKRELGDFKHMYKTIPDKYSSILDNTILKIHWKI